jgi:putative phosphoribosyl transferase
MTTLSAVIEASGTRLEGDLTLPHRASGVVAFAHGSGSSRFSSRNRFVAEVLHQAGIGTLLFDLLTEPESGDGTLVFNIPLLAERLLAAADWLGAQPGARDLPLGFFGASTGAAAALVAAAERPEAVGAVVSRGGRPDLAEPRLGDVKAPTLLIVGGEDRDVLRLNRRAFAELHCPKHLVVVPGATHLFEEPGALEQAAHHAAEWFRSHLVAGTPAGLAPAVP